MTNLGAVATPTATAAHPFGCPFQTANHLPHDFTLQQLVDVQEKVVKIELTRPKHAWLGVGLGGYSSTHAADGAFVVGLPETNEVFVTSAESFDIDSGEPGKRMDFAGLQDASIKQNATHTSLAFSVANFDYVSKETVPQTVSVAGGFDNHFGLHEWLFSHPVQMDECLTSAVEQEGHGAFIPASSSRALQQENQCSFTREAQLGSANSGVSIKEVMGPRNESVTVEMVYESRGWLGLALASNAKMIGSIAVIGLPGSGTVAKYFLGGKAISAVTRLPAQNQTLTNTNMTQNATHTIMKFTKRLVEEGERTIFADGLNTAIFATGRGNSLASGTHSNFGAFQIALTPCQESDSLGPLLDDPINVFNNEARHPNLWKAHGILMTVSWGLFVPLAICSSLLRDILPEGSWFKLHLFFNVSAIICTVTAFVLAFYAIHDAAKDSGLSGKDIGHFEETDHRLVGTIVVLLCIIHAVFAACRPHAPGVKVVEPESENKTESNEDDVVQETSPDEEEVYTEDKSSARSIWEFLHRFIGLGLVAMGWFNIHRGIELYEERFGDIFEERDTATLFWAGIIGMAAALVVLLILRRSM